MSYPLQHQLQAPLSMSNQTHAVMDATRTQTTLSNLKTSPLTKKNVGGGNTDIFKHHLPMAT